MKKKNKHIEKIKSKLEKLTKKRLLAVVVIASLLLILFQLFVPTRIGIEAHTALNEIPTLAVGFRQQLYAEGDGASAENPEANLVMFPSSMFFRVSSNSPDDVFESLIVDSLYEKFENWDGNVIPDVIPIGRIFYNQVRVWEDTSEGRKHWGPALREIYLGDDELTEIHPYHKYWVFVPVDCILEIV